MMFFPLEALFALHQKYCDLKDISGIDLATPELGRFQEYFSHLHLNIEDKNEFFAPNVLYFI